jgi:Ran GTPase-activating protein 1
LIDKTSLVEINLSDNAFGGRSVDPMIPFLKQNRSFQVLKLNNNGLGPAGGAVVAGALLESANLSRKEGKKSNLRTVICGRNRLEDGSAPKWAEAFAAHGTLGYVSMPQNGIRQDGIVALAEGLAKCPDLEELDLQDNAFNVDGSEDGAKAMAKSLPLWKSLRRLDFSDCVLSNEGEVPAVLAVLASGSNPKLQKLQLQNNNLETESFKLLAESVGQHLPELKSLELQWNEVEEDDEHLDALSDALKARGGKLTVNDEDEEEEEEEEAAEDDDDDTEVKDNKITSKLDQAADELADLLAKARIG